MKIWEAKLLLTLNENDEFKTYFTLEKQEKEYKLNKYNNEEWTCGEGWIVNRIPINMTISPTSTGLIKIIQGFDRELSKEEIIQLEKDMRVVMKKQLIYEKDMYLKKYQEKLESI
jgi:hypothetical protein